MRPPSYMEWIIYFFIFIFFGMDHLEYFWLPGTEYATQSALLVVWKLVAVWLL